MNWPTVKINNLCLPTVYYDPRQAPDTPFRYVDISSIDREKKVITHTPEIMGAEAPSRARKRILAGDILVSTVRPNLNAVAIVPDELDGQIASTGFCVLRPCKKVVENKYLFFYTITNDFIGNLCSQVRGAHYPAVSDTDVKQVEIPLPPISEQRRIVEILEQADALRKKRADADAKASRILPALFYKMFSDPLKMVVDNNAENLGNIGVELQNGFACGYKDVIDGVPHLRMNNIDDKGILNLSLIRTVPLEYDREKYRLKNGDLLFMSTNSEDKVGKTCVFYPPDDRHFLFSNHLTRIRITNAPLSPEYLSAYLHLLWQKGFYSSLIKRWVNQASMSNQAISSINVPIPSKNKDTIFSNAVKEIHALRHKTDIAHDEVETLFRTLLHRAFSGDLTAEWREAHMKELLAEMEAQAKALESMPDDDTIRINGKRHAGHDMYEKAALAAYITQKCHSPQYPLGRVKLAKIFYLVQRKAELELTQTFAKRAAGPLDDAIFKFMSLAKKKKWVSFGRKQGDLQPVFPGAQAQEAVESASKLLGDSQASVDALIEKIKTYRREALERWATVLHTAEELLAAGAEPTLQNIKNALLRDPAWKAKLKRDEFSDSNITSTLNGLRLFGFLITNNQKG